MKQLLLTVFSFLVCTMSWGQDPELVRKAEAGDIKAQGKLAYAYCHAFDGVKKEDYYKAAQWAKPAAEAGDAQAQEVLGYLYEFGKGGMHQNDDVAAQWYYKAAVQGQELATFCLGDYFRKKDDNEKAVYWYKKHMDLFYQMYGIESGLSKGALENLGVTYHPGSNSYTASRSCSSSSSSSSGNKLLYSGTYTISNRGRSSNTGQYTDAWGSDMVCEIEVYEKSLTIKQEDEISYSYTYSGNSGSLRKYESDWGESATIYVNPVTFAMRKEVFSSFSFGGFTNTDTFVYAMTKGKTTYDYNNPSAYSSGNGGYNSNSGGYSSGGSGTTTRTYETSCLQCGGSGKCKTCNGDHRYINPLTGNYVTCPNCGTDGCCRSCGGTGKKTKTIR